MNTKELLNDIEDKICRQELTKEQVFTKMKSIIQTLERSDNSDYAVTPESKQEPRFGGWYLCSTCGKTVTNGKLCDICNK